MSSRAEHWIVPIDAYEGKDTGITLVGDRERGRLYAVIETGPRGATLVDNGYRTRSEARRAWPDAR
jgi:hypothetical protein